MPSVRDALVASIKSLLYAFQTEDMNVFALTQITRCTYKTPQTHTHGFTVPTFFYDVEICGTRMT